ncbi:MAG TPA: DUF4252 domain-containing protein [Bryobacterales bacterium]|jgi:hypothetical protein|nr:DUF4252 domain-containing protein [Bryobacterales bacterium]
MKGAALIACLLACAPAFGQGAKLQLNLDHLAAKAAEVANVNLEGPMLEMGRKFLSRKDADKDVKALVDSLTGVYVRSFEFSKPGDYTQADVESIRKQLNAPGWTKFIDVQESKNGETTCVYSYLENGKMAGLAVLAAEPRELTVVNIVGPIDLSKLGQLQGQLGIPDLKLEMRPRSSKPATAKK